VKGGAVEFSATAAVDRLSEVAVAQSHHLIM